MTYSPVDNEEAIAYGWFAMAIFLAIAAFIYAVYIGVINSMISGPNNDNSVGINHDIASGKLSKQGRNAAQFNIDFAMNIPLFVLIGAFIWSVNRAIYVKQGGG